MHTSGHSVPVSISVKKIRDNSGIARCSHVALAPAGCRNEAGIQTGPLPSPNLSEYFEQVPVPAFMIDRNKKVMIWNHAMEVLTGVQKLRSSGRPVTGKRYPYIPN